MTYAQERRDAARAYLDWQKRLIEAEMPAEGPSVDVIRNFNISTAEAWSAWKLTILRFTLTSGTYGQDVRPLYSAVADVLGISVSVLQRRISAARQLGWLRRVRKSGAAGGGNGGGLTAVFRIAVPVDVAEDDDDFDEIDGTTPERQPEPVAPVPDDPGRDAEHGPPDDEPPWRDEPAPPRQRSRRSPHLG